MMIVQLAPAARLVLVNVIGSIRPATLLLGIVPVQVPRAPPMKLCAAVLERFVGQVVGDADVGERQRVRVGDA